MIQRFGKYIRLSPPGLHAKIPFGIEKVTPVKTEKIFKADAEAISIYAQAYSQGPDFYSFLKTLETYQKTIDENSTIILTTDSDYYKYLKGLGEAK